MIAGSMVPGLSAPGFYSTGVVSCVGFIRVGFKVNLEDMHIELYIILDQ